MHSRMSLRVVKGFVQEMVKGFVQEMVKGFVQEANGRLSMAS